MFLSLSFTLPSSLSLNKILFENSIFGGRLFHRLLEIASSFFGGWPCLALGFPATLPQCSKHVQAPSMHDCRVICWNIVSSFDVDKALSYIGSQQNDSEKRH